MWLCGWLCGWLFDFACLCVWLRRRSIPDVNFWFLPKSQWMTSEIFTAVRSHLSCSNQHTHIQHRAYTYSPWCGNFLFSFLVAISLSLSLCVSYVFAWPFSHLLSLLDKTLPDTSLAYSSTDPDSWYLHHTPHTHTDPKKKYVSPSQQPLTQSNDIRCHHPTPANQKHRAHTQNPGRIKLKMEWHNSCLSWFGHWHIINVCVPFCHTNAHEWLYQLPIDSTNLSSCW